MRLLILAICMIWCVYAQHDGPVPPRALIPGAIPGAIQIPIRGGARQGRLIGGPPLRRPVPPNGFYRAISGATGAAPIPSPPPSYGQSPLSITKPVTEDIDEEDNYNDRNEDIDAQIAQKQALLSQLPSLSEIGPPSQLQFRPEPRPLPVARAQQIRPQEPPRQIQSAPVPQRTRVTRPQPQPVEQPLPQRGYVSQQQQQAVRGRGGEKKPVAQTIRKFHDENPDGSITWGYENDDGSFKEETIGNDCITRGKYGYVDPDGLRREYSYETGLPCDTVPEEEPQPILPPEGARRPPIGYQSAYRP